MFQTDSLAAPAAYSPCLEDVSLINGKLQTPGFVIRGTLKTTANPLALFPAYSCSAHLHILGKLKLSTLKGLLPRVELITTHTVGIQNVP